MSELEVSKLQDLNLVVAIGELFPHFLVVIMFNHAIACLCNSRKDWQTGVERWE